MSHKQKKSSPVSRRDFMKDSATKAAGVAAGTAAARTALAQATEDQYQYKRTMPPEVVGANEMIYTGHIGIGGMGRADLGFVLQRDDMRPIALCDLWWKNLMRAEQQYMNRKYKEGEYTTHHDFREVIDNKDVDAVVIATPDHWHCLCTLHAADAGKHIYCEKPAATTIEEGRAMVTKVREKGVVFQAGNMQRSGTHFQEAVKLVQDGYIGKVARVEAYIHDSEDVNGITKGDDDISNYAGCDWEFHQGWVEHQPFNTNRWIYNFRWFTDYSGGKITDWGAHLVDIGLWAMGEDKAPRSVSTASGKFVVDDNRTTPDTLEVVWEFDDYVLSFGNRVWNPTVPEGRQNHGTIFYGTQGTLYVDRSGYEVVNSGLNGGCEDKKVGPSQLNEPHWQNFADCVRSGEDPISSVEVIHNTTKICHMGTCAYIADAKLGWDDEKEKFTGGDKEAVKIANDFAYRKYNNGWSLEAPYQSA